MSLYIVCYGIFPLIILLQLKKVSCNEKEWLSKEQTDSIRGIAIFTIMLHHIVLKVAGEFPWAYPFAQMGTAGVAVFFLLSGYAHAYIYRKRDLDKHFLWNKCKRMLIPFLLIWIVYICLMIIKGIEINWVQCIFEIFQLKFPGTLCWYFKIQLLLYIIFYLCFEKLGKFKSLAFKFGAVTVGVLSYVLIAYVIGLESFWYLTVMYFPIGLWLGGYKEKIYKNLFKYSSIIVFISIVLFGSVHIIMFFKGYGSYYYPLQIIMAFSFTCACIFILWYIDFQSSILKFLGRISLELYLVHGLLLEAECLKLWNFYKGGDIWVYISMSISIAWVVNYMSKRLKDMLNRVSN